MKFFQQPSFQLLCALFALFVVAGDLVADSFHDATGACATESQSGDHASCPACSCALHVGAALGPNSSDTMLPNQIATQVADRALLKLPTAAAEIDHPPQLA